LGPFCMINAEHATTLWGGNFAIPTVFEISRHPHLYSVARIVLRVAVWLQRPFFSFFSFSISLSRKRCCPSKKKKLSSYFSRISDPVLFLFFILISFVNFKFIFNFTLDWNSICLLFYFGFRFDTHSFDFEFLFLFFCKMF
jgi:hypothetical protein